MDQIIVHNLSKQFGHVIALDIINLNIKSGKIYALLGHNGSGKTTLIKHILGIYKLFKGLVGK